jgi:hypothetical protein
VWEGGLERQKSPIQGHRHDFSPAGVIDSLDLRLAPKRRVVHQHVNAAKCSSRFRNCRLNSLRISNVSCDDNGPPAHRSNKLGRLLSFLDGSARVHSNVSATLCQGVRNRTSDVARGTSDEGDSSL